MKNLRIVSMLLAVLMVLGLFAGCAKEETPAGGEENKTEQSGTQSGGDKKDEKPAEKREDLVIAMLEDMETFDPLGSSAVNTQAIHRHMYAKLYLND